MDPPSSDVPKLSDMVMCGDHPSFTKTELNAKEVKPEDKLKEKIPMSYARISPTASRIMSEHGLRAAPVRRLRADTMPRVEADVAAPANRALVQAALGSFRWPPYLLCVWVLVLVLTHALHCLVNVLERTLPSFKKICQYFRAWTEESWKAERDLNQRVCPLALGALTGGLYALYAALCAAHALAVWAVEPLCPEPEQPGSDVGLRVTNYLEEVASKTNASVKH